MNTENMKNQKMDDASMWRLLVRLSLPVMLALLIQSVYNIVDSYFIGKYSPEGLTALSIIFPIQLLMTALATGTGAGLNILIARMDGTGRSRSQKRLLRRGMALGCFNFICFAAAGLLLCRGYYHFSSNQPLVREYGIQYTRIILLFSMGMFLEANCTKILHAKGSMILPMAAQVAGALVNVVLDPILIFGQFGLPAMGIRGAAIATVAGQWCAMGIVLTAVLRLYKRLPFQEEHEIAKPIYKDWSSIYQAGLPSIVMQSLNTLYIIGLNLVLKSFSEDAVTVLGIYYKLQTFFFIPLLGLQQVILPVISYHYGAGNKKQIRDTLYCSIGIGLGVMGLGMASFMLMPKALLSIFSVKPEILSIGKTALPIISISFLPAAFVIMLTVYFQGVDQGLYSLCVTVLRQLILLVPLAWVFHFFGLKQVWLTFPVTEILSASCAIFLYRKGRAREMTLTR